MWPTCCLPEPRRAQHRGVPPGLCIIACGRWFSCSDRMPECGQLAACQSFGARGRVCHSRRTGREPPSIDWPGFSGKPCAGRSRRRSWNLSGVCRQSHAALAPSRLSWNSPVGRNASGSGRVGGGCLADVPRRAALWSCSGFYAFQKPPRGRGPPEQVRQSKFLVSRRTAHGRSRDFV